MRVNQRSVLRFLGHSMLDLGDEVESEDPKRTLTENVHDEPLPRISLIRNRLIILILILEWKDLEVDLGPWEQSRVDPVSRPRMCLRSHNQHGCRTNPCISESLLDILSLDNRIDHRRTFDDLHILARADRIDESLLESAFDLLSSIEGIRTARMSNASSPRIIHVGSKIQRKREMLLGRLHQPVTTRNVGDRHDDSRNHAQREIVAVKSPRPHQPIQNFGVFQPLSFR